MEGFILYHGAHSTPGGHNPKQWAMEVYRSPSGVVRAVAYNGGDKPVMNISGRGNFKVLDRMAVNALGGFVRAAASAKVVKKCHRCGRTFVERPMPKRTCSSLSALYSHRYCPSCTWAMKRAARICDPRYASVGGHSDILETGR